LDGAAPQAGEHGEEVLASLGDPGRPPGVAARGPEDDLVAVAQRPLDGGFGGPPGARGPCRRDLEVVDEDREGAA
jgi:hypothetical protein